MKRMVLVLFLSTSLACSATDRPSVAQGVAVDAEFVVRQLEEKRFAAMMARDTTVLEGLLGDELTYAHSTGTLENKAHFLETIAGGAIEYLSITPRDTTARIYDRMVVMHGLADVSVRIAGAPQAFTLRYTDAWVSRGGRWQMILWQSTRVP